MGFKEVKRGRGYGGCCLCRVWVRETRGAMTVHEVFEMFIV